MQSRVLPGFYVVDKCHVTIAKDQTGIDGVANSCTRVTASSNNAVLLQPVSLASGTRISSVYLKRLSGSGLIQCTLDGSTWSTVELSSAEWRRVVLAGTITNPCVGVRLATSGDSVAMDYAQIEDGGFVTTPIMTTTSSVTRSIDSVSIPAGNWHNLSGGTLIVEAMDAVTTTTNSTLVQFGTINIVGAGQHYGVYIRTQRNLFAILSRTPESGFGPNIFVNCLDNNYKISASFAPSIFVGCGNADMNAGTAGSLLDKITSQLAMFLGGTALSKCTIKRVSYVPKSLSATATVDLSR